VLCVVDGVACPVCYLADLCFVWRVHGVVFRVRCYVCRALCAVLILFKATRFDLCRLCGVRCCGAIFSEIGVVREIGRVGEG